MKEVETEGKTLQDALRKAQIILEVPLEEIEYKILEVGREGILGVGAKPYRIFAWVKKKEEESLIEFVKNLLKKMNIKAKVNSHKKDFLLVSIEGENLGRLIGYNGKNLSAFELILRIYAQRIGIKEKVVLDIDHYKERREAYLVNLANKLAKKVEEKKEPISLRPLPARERRIIHLALQNNPKVYTYSVGEEPNRYVVIAPKEGL
ncbi:MAG: protein jag [Dictyoglomus sp. NZ13-RE01]|nr:MAG: protein jag [Dictyoglomus sp. NZ13-RE01]